MTLVRVRARARVCFLCLSRRGREYASCMPRARARVYLLGEGILLVRVRARPRVCL